MGKIASRNPDWDAAFNLQVITSHFAVLCKAQNCQKPLTVGKASNRLYWQVYVHFTNLLIPSANRVIGKTRWLLQPCLLTFFFFTPRD